MPENGDVDLRIPPKFPGPIELLGGVAGLLPFVISFSSTRSTSVNGAVTSFVYRDWVAVGGGAVAALCGVVALLALRRPGKKGARAAVAVGLLALGGVQVARGMGLLMARPEVKPHLIDLPPEAPAPADAAPKQCSDGESCLKEALAQEDAKHEGVAAAGFLRACDLGSGAGCFEAARAADGTDARRALVLYEKGCDQGDPRSCNNLGARLGDGRGTDKDPARAAKSYQRGCPGVAIACVNLGRMYEAGEGVAKDAAKAVALYRQACELDSPSGCNDLGAAYDNGMGLQKDPAGAAEMFERACSGDLAVACVNLAKLNRVGRGVKKDLRHARELFARACKLDSVEGCFEVGLMYDGGEGGPKDAKAAVSSYDWACEAGHGGACNNLGFMTEHGEGGLAVDKEAARQLYQTACHDGDETGCENAKRLAK